MEKHRAAVGSTGVGSAVDAPRSRRRFIYVRGHRVNEHADIHGAAQDQHGIPQLSIPAIEQTERPVGWRRLARADERSLWSCALDTLATSAPHGNRASPADHGYPFWSPDGRLIGSCSDGKTQEDRWNVVGDKPLGGCWLTRRGGSRGPDGNDQLQIRKTGPCTASRLPEGRRLHCESSTASRQELTAASGLTSSTMANITSMSRGAPMPNRPASMVALSDTQES